MPEIRSEPSPMQAARRVCDRLRRRYGISGNPAGGPEVWDRATIESTGWIDADAAVYWEDGPETWPYTQQSFVRSTRFEGDMRPFRSWLLGFAVKGADRTSDRSTGVAG